jgi:hypothetical protein
MRKIYMSGIGSKSSIQEASVQVVKQLFLYLNFRSNKQLPIVFTVLSDGILKTEIVKWESFLRNVLQEMPLFSHFKDPGLLLSRYPLSKCVYIAGISHTFPSYENADSSNANPSSWCLETDKKTGF